MTLTEQILVVVASGVILASGEVYRAVRDVDTIREQVPAILQTLARIEERQITINERLDRYENSKL